MHEFSLCESLVRAILHELAGLGASPPRLVKAVVSADRMQYLVPDNLTRAFEILTRGTVAEGAVLELRIVPLIGRCTDCGAAGDVADPPGPCPSCGSHRVEVRSTGGVTLESLEVEADEDPNRQDLS